MLFLRQPTDTYLEQFAARQVSQTLSYNFPGLTKSPPQTLPGWKIDRERVLLGHGEDVYRRAQSAIERWAMFPSAVASVFRPTSPAIGQNVVVVYFTAPLQMWMVFPARVIYCRNDSEEPFDRFGFAYGTLSGHPERGEERFLVEWNRRDDTVWYDLLAISRPGHWLARLGYPYTRLEQARFRKLSSQAMRAAVIAAPG